MDTNAIEIREASNDAELEAIYRFRYEIYVEEMGRKQKYADHDGRRIADPLDANGWNVAAWVDNEIVGAVRTNPFDEPATDEYAALYQVEQNEKTQRASSVIVTRLMTDRHLRKSDLGERLAIDCYKRILAADYQFVYIDCNDYLIDWFTGLGFRTTRDVLHSEYGQVMVMVLNVNDIEHLEKCRSPFLVTLTQSTATTVGRNL